MLEMHLKHIVLVGNLQKTKKEYKGLKKQEIHDILSKACFQNDVAHGDFKDLTRRKASEEILQNKAFNIAKNQKNDGYQPGLASMVYNFLTKKFLVFVFKIRIFQTKN